MMASSSLSSVVSQLMRASVGASVTDNVSDQDLDRFVTDLILKEAKQAEERYKGKEGIRVYLPHTGLPDSNLPRANKRFLGSIIKNVDDHNSALLRVQATTAGEKKLAREEADREERRTRAVEASKERLRRLMDGGRRPNPERGSKDDWKRGARDEKSLKRPRDRGVEESEGMYHDSKRSRRNNYVELGDHSTRYTRHSPTTNDIPTSRRLNSPRANSSPSQNSMSPEIGPQPEDQPLPEARGSPSHASRYDIPYPLRDEGASSSGYRDHSRSPLPQVHMARSLSRDDDLGSCRPSHRHRHRQRHYDDGSMPCSRSQSRSRSPHRSHRHSRESSSRKDKDDKDEREWSSRSHHHHTRERLLNSSRKHVDDERRKRDRSPNAQSEDDYPSPSLLTRPLRSTKMDRYFDPNYDPAFDYQPSLKMDEFVQEGAFDDWDTMLELIRARREDRAERKRREGLGISVSSDTMGNIVYKKRGSVREWDLGKE